MDLLKPFNPSDKTILVVEDDPSDALIAKRALETYGIKKAFFAETAEQALSWLGKNKCDLALVDHHLPGMTGLKFLSHVREQFPETSVIVVTGAKDDKIAADVFRAGAADYVSKDDFLTSGIISSLQTALRRRATESAEDHRMALGDSEHSLSKATEEAVWLLGQLTGHHGAGLDASESLQEVVYSFAQYLRIGMQAFPDRAKEEEDSLCRMLLSQGLSPRDVLTVFKAALVLMNLEEPSDAADSAAIHPTLLLSMLLARLVEEYQQLLALAYVDAQRIANSPSHAA